jgi:hypothetical protein
VVEDGAIGPDGRDVPWEHLYGAQERVGVLISDKYRYLHGIDSLTTVPVYSRSSFMRWSVALRLVLRLVLSFRA